MAVENRRHAALLVAITGWRWDSETSAIIRLFTITDSNRV